MTDYYKSSAEETLKELQTSQTGLISQQAQARQEKYGINKLKEAEKPGFLKRFFLQLKDPMLLILLAAAAVSALTGMLSGESEWAETIIILVVVLLNALLGVIQEQKAEAAIEALQSMTAATCKVLRDGNPVVLPSVALVPGDVVLLEAGDAVPADGRILESASLKIEEAALTGESVLVNKVLLRRSRRISRSATGKICAIWAPPSSTGAAKPSSPQPGWPPKWARSPA